MNYLVVYQAPISVRERFADATPDEALAGVRQWVDWQARVGDALVYSGAPIGGGLRVTAAATEPIGSSIVGISILRAPDLETALSMVHDHHHLRWSEDCTIELLEEMPIPELAPPPDPARRAGPA